MTTVTMPRSQRSTLQREPVPPPDARTSRSRLQDSNRKFRSHEKYFEHKAYVFGHKYSSTREMMWTGKHSFPFTYCLPSKLPASFHGRYGYVRYFCEASLERHNLPTVQRRAFFSVNNVMDLNTDSKADSGVSKEKKTNSWCFCCASGTIIVSAKVRRRGFVPGETIPIQAHILNVSNKTISKISAKIIQIATYYSSKAFRNHADETVVCEKTEGRVPPGESTTWEETGPRVPPIPPSSSMIDCKLITVGYRLDFVLDVIGMKESVVLKMPLRIGTIPLEKTFKRMSETGDEDGIWAPLKTSLPLQILLKYPKIPEAYSLKCVKGDRNVNRYYFRQIPRSMNSMVGINLRMPNAPLQPVLTDESETYAPRYLTYREVEVGGRGDGGEFPGRMTGAFFQVQEVKETLNGGVAIAGEGCQRHLVIQVSPPRVTPSSTTQLVSDTASIGSESPEVTPEPGLRRRQVASAPSSGCRTDPPEESKKDK
ncbi:UNVERIFIED_CONTAM: hypothetical protein PYX00_007999 [Menopon gallinae]|uniref:Arrestin C-terminal-like domain-containing protein n=1 Tax=Menopon gallinae TaxID=328185 RepID=A0AAW2HLG8_9NEOP